jgi:hypothetical protein
MKTVRLVLIMFVVFFLTACDYPKPRTLSKDLCGIAVVDKQYDHMREAIDHMRDNMVFFQKGKKCFAAILTRVGDGYAVASFTLIPCEGIEDICNPPKLPFYEDTPPIR